MKKVLVLNGSRRIKGFKVWDVSTPEQSRQSFHALFAFLETRDEFAWLTQERLQKECDFLSESLEVRSKLDTIPRGIRWEAETRIQNIPAIEKRLEAMENALNNLVLARRGNVAAIRLLIEDEDVLVDYEIMDVEDFSDAETS